MRWSTRRQVFACAQKLFQDGQRIKDCQEWCESQTFLTGHSLQGQSPPPPSWSACLNELQVCVRMRMRMGVGVRVRVRRKYLFVLLNKVETD